MAAAMIRPRAESTDEQTTRPQGGLQRTDGGVAAAVLIQPSASLDALHGPMPVLIIINPYNNRGGARSSP
jgi:hypothetical protein